MEGPQVDKQEQRMKQEPTENGIHKVSILEATQSVTDRIVGFLSSATNETLGICIVGLGAGTYVVLGRLGLILIGVVGGVALHASWEARGASGHDSQELGRRREIGAEVVNRLIRWREDDKKKELDNQDKDQELDVRIASGQRLDFSGFQPGTAAALNGLTDAIIRDYVK